MKRWAILCAALAALLLPNRGTELGELHPIAVLTIRKDTAIHVLTDTGDTGEGETLEAALQNLEETTAGHLFLDTVQTVLLEEETMYLLPNVKEKLRPMTCIARMEGEINPEEAAEYLHIYPPKQRLKDAGEEGITQTLISKEGKLSYAKSQSLQ